MNRNRRNRPTVAGNQRRKRRRESWRQRPWFARSRGNGFGNLHHRGRPERRPSPNNRRRCWPNNSKRLRSSVNQIWTCRRVIVISIHLNTFRLRSDRDSQNNPMHIHLITKPQLTPKSKPLRDCITRFPLLNTNMPHSLQSPSNTTY